MVCDIILCAVLIVSMIMGFKRGLLRTVWGLAALVAAIILTVMLKPFIPDIGVVGVILLFIAIRILLAFVYRILSVILSLPVLKQTNQLLGSALQLIIAMVFSFAALAAVEVLAPQYLEGATLCTSINEHNILLALFGFGT